MGVPGDNLDGLERQRLELESNILQLQQSLYHWRIWESEYDGLKEEIRALDDDATTSDFLRVSREFDGSLVNEDEVRVMIGEKQGLKRTRQQVADIISRRIDYVRDNVSSMEKRLCAAENKLSDLDGAEELPSEATADFPMKEIIEELDEDGEIISSTTTNPGDQAADLLDVLKKAGVENIPDVPSSSESTAVSEQTFSSSTLEESSTNVEDADSQTDDLAAALASTSLEGKKTSAAHGHQSDKVEPSVEEEEVPIIDVDESPEDAQLRREMLRYGLDEVGAVVAELELDEDGSEISVDDAYDFGDYDDDEEEEEDEYGRSTRSVLDEDYHQQMRELEAKLNARGMWNVGKDTTSLPENVQEDLQHAHKIKIDRAPESSSETAPKAKPKKKVAFADDLDIAPAPKPPAPESKKAAPRETEVAVLSESIVERTKPVETPATPSVAAKKTSRFKSARGLAGADADGQSTSSISSSQLVKPLRKAVVAPTPALPLFPAKPSEPKPFSQPISDIIEMPSVPTRSERKILADTLVERDTSEGTAMAPEPDELDEELHRKEIATEFYRLRNRLAKRTENSHEEEPEMVPVEPEEPQGRISKFRASRMG
ncbi:Prefoldin subunit-domain-containing protein [Aspergillus pseudoustus]|uniref:Prefoldin subunit-domain-containing protein n=1 Tax=Aspergillus pseudoustus TaxID=1810923 RepID=A0ABR4JQ54_9EURO